MSLAGPRVRVALVGHGPWGKNLLRVLASSDAFEVIAVADHAPEARAAARARLDAHGCAARVVASLGELAPGDLALDAAVIATPPATHARLALECLDAGLDVFVEKPLALRPADAARCAARAKRLGRVAMVGHILRYHPTACRLIDLAARGDLGRPKRLVATRFSSGAPVLDTAESVWNLGPHDLSVLRAIDGSALVELTCERASEPGFATLRLELASGLEARIALGAGAIAKERRVALECERGVAVFDDVLAPSRVRVTSTTGGNARELSADSGEPLRVELEHFAACVRSRATPRTSFDEGVESVEWLARAVASLARAGQPRRGVELDVVSGAAQ